MTSPAKRGRTDSGFTLLEMVVVVLVLGLAAGLVIQRGPPHSAAIDLRAATEEVARTLRLARARAIATGRDVAVRFAGHDFAADGAAARALPASMALDIVATAPGNTGRVAAIGFAPDGSSSGGRIGLGEGARHAEIGIDWLTGRVRVLSPR